MDGPAPSVTIPVVVQVGATSPLVSSRSSISLTYTTGAAPTGSGVTQSSNFTSSGSNVFFTLNSSTLPLWLQVTPTSATTPASVVFTVTNGAETLSPGLYTANVHFQVSGDVDFVIPVSLQVENPAARLSAAEGQSRSVTWVLGSALPTLTITAVSSGAPISFTVAPDETTCTGSCNPLNPVLSTTSGIAYSFGTPITVTFSSATFGTASPGEVLQGNVIFTYNTSSTYTVALTVTVLDPQATITSASPAAVPTGTTGSFPLVLVGSGFVATGGGAPATIIGIVPPGSNYIAPDANLVVTQVTANAISLTVNAPANDPLLPLATGGSFTIGVCNPPPGGACTVPTGQISIVIGVNPIIQSVTNAASFAQATPPALNTLAPYDIISLFGTNFCISGGTGCTGQPLYGTAAPTTYAYPTQLSPDPANASTVRNLQVTFQTHGNTGAAKFIANAPLLFATNNQINAVVPSAVSSYVNEAVDVVVTFGYGQAGSSTLLTSAPYTVTIATYAPGVFTSSGDGQGGAAALLATSPYNAISQTAPSNVRSGSLSDIVSLYLAGLGVPDSTSMSSSCVPIASYLQAVQAAATAAGLSNSQTPQTVDGLVMQTSVYTSLNYSLPPCQNSTDTNYATVKIGGVEGTVSYAGWAPGAIAGLYQINVQLPDGGSSFTDANGNPVTISSDPSSPTFLPITITAPGTSQAGVTLAVVRSLQLTPSGTTTSSAGAPWSGTWAVAVTGGSGTYSFGTSGNVPTGLSIQAVDATHADFTSGSTNLSTGTYTFDVTVTDTSTSVSTSISVTLTIQ
jgi:uncharacterized protein (TIGR03437 family)